MSFGGRVGALRGSLYYHREGIRKNLVVVMKEEPRARGVERKRLPPRVP